MIKLLSSRLFWGIMLVIGGALLLLDTFGIFEGTDLFWTIFAGLAGVLFLGVYFANRENWWALIPGIIFLSISAAIGLDSFVREFHDANLVGPTILAGIGISFFLVYLAERSNWWGIIPGGVMSTITIVAVLDSNGNDFASGGVFFLGLGITFALVAILPNTVGHMRWAWIPAGILGLMGLLILIGTEDSINYLWPSALILAGIVLVWRSLRAK
jgi:hypothetical protein